MKNDNHILAKYTKTEALKPILKFRFTVLLSLLEDSYLYTSCTSYLYVQLNFTHTVKG